MSWTNDLRALLGAGAGLALLLGTGCESNTADESCDKPGMICTWAGTGKLGFNGDGKALTESNMYWPVDLTISDQGTYVLDWNNHRVREVKKDGTFETVIGTDFVGDGPDDHSDLMPPGAPGTEVTLNHPTQFVPMQDGTLTLVSWHNHKLRNYDPNTGLVTVTCGNAPGFKGDEGPAKMAQLNQPAQMVLGEDNTQYIVDQRNQVIRSIDPDGVIHTIAGTPKMPGFAGDGGDAKEAMLSFPTGSNPPTGGGLALAGGFLYISDTLNHRIRALDLENGTIDTIAGTGEKGFSGDGGEAVDAQLNNPRKLTIGPDGRLYVGDQDNNRIRAIDLDSGEIETVAGNGDTGFSGDGVPPTEASIDHPVGVTFDEDGAMYIMDTLNSRIRRVLPEDKP
jgi:outer membrane protein assembly factor BamB